MVGTIKESIKLLCEHKELTGEQITESIREIITQEATPAQIGAFLLAMRLKEPSPATIFHCAKAMLSHSIPCQAGDNLIDIVGTGGKLAILRIFEYLVLIL